MNWIIWPEQATRVSDIFAWQIRSCFWELDRFLDWHEWARSPDGMFYERAPPNSVRNQWSSRIKYEAAKNLLDEGFAISAALLQLQWQLFDVVTSKGVCVKTFDGRASVERNISVQVLEPDIRPVLGRGVWFSSRVIAGSNIDQSQATPVAVYFEHDDAIGIEAELARQYTDLGIDGHSIPQDRFDFHRPRERARYALMNLFGAVVRPHELSQEAVHELVNEFLVSNSLSKVSKDTVRRAIGERS